MKKRTVKSPKKKLANPPSLGSVWRKVEARIIRRGKKSLLQVR